MGMHADPWVSARRPAVGLLGLVLAAAGLAGAAAAAAAPPAAAAPVYVARAHLVEVRNSMAVPDRTPMSGAGVRAFQEPRDDTTGAERFDIRWYANPPGIPPGLVVLLESVQERSPVVRNHVLQTPAKTEGHVLSTIEIPAADVRRAGRVLKWRVSLVWRGRLLARQASANWEG